jgi:hypothetical protein
MKDFDTVYSALMIFLIIIILIVVGYLAILVGPQG